MDYIFKYLREIWDKIDIYGTIIIMIIAGALIYIKKWSK